VPFVIAGKKPSEKLHRLAKNVNNACIIADPGEQEMEDMISKAQINITPSFNCTGTKLKVLNAVFAGRHCITNEQAVLNTGLENACHLAKSPDDFKKLVSELYQIPFTEKEIAERSELLSGIYNNKKNAEKLIAWLW
jgi:transcriptional regulator with AAA-type ATPase domain